MDKIKLNDLDCYKVGDFITFNLRVLVNVKTSPLSIDRDKIRKHLYAIIHAYLESLIND